MINVSIIMKARSEKREELLRLVHSTLIGEERNLVGYQEADDQTAVRVDYQWNNREELERYFETAKIRAFLGILKDLCETWEFSFGPSGNMAGRRMDRRPPSIFVGPRIITRFDT